MGSAYSLFSTKDRTTEAVFSGRRVRLRPLRSVKVYISLSTTSVPSPIPLWKSSVCSKIGVLIS